MPGPERTARITVSWRKRRLRFLRILLPLAIWLAAAAAYVFLRFDSTLPPTLKGSLEPRQMAVTAPDTGRIASVAVAPFDVVEKDGVLAMLDERPLLQRARRVHADILVIQAEEEAYRRGRAESRSRFRASAHGEARRFFEESARHELGALRIRAELEPLEIRRKRLTAERDRLRSLDQRKAVSARELQDQELRVSELEIDIAERRKVVAALELEHRRSTRRLENATTPPDEVDEYYGVFAARVRERREVLEQISESRESLVIRSPARGVVSSVLTQPGQSVPFGETLFTISGAEDAQIVIFAVPDVRAEELEGAVVELWPMYESEAPTRAIVRAVSPAVERLPVRLWRDPSRPEFGRALLIDTPDGHEFRMGERIEAVLVGGGESDARP